MAAGAGGSWEALLAQYDWPLGEAIAVMLCESSGNPLAYNYTPVWVNEIENHATGLFQLLMPLHAWRLDGGDTYDPAVNVRAAYTLWKQSGWSPWRACKYF